MVDIEKILNVAIEKDASDIHLISGIKPCLRIKRELIELSDFDDLAPEDMFDIYDYFIRGNIEKDEVFKKEKKLDSSYEFGETRIRVNISIADETPVVVLRLIKSVLPKYEDLGVPDIVRRMTLQPQGLILVTGKTNSRKNNNTKCFNK